MLELFISVMPDDVLVVCGPIFVPEDQQIISSSKKPPSHTKDVGSSTDGLALKDEKALYRSSFVRRYQIFLGVMSQDPSAGYSNSLLITN